MVPWYMVGSSVVTQNYARETSWSIRFVSGCGKEADVCYHFLYNRWHTAMQVLLGYFVARELGIAHTICRDFQWTEMIVWEWEFPQINVDTFKVILGDEDFLTDCKGMVDYLLEAGVPEECITVCRGYQHGQALCAEGFGMQEALRAL